MPVLPNLVSLRVATIREDDLRLALRVPAESRHDSKLEQQQLHVLRKLLAVRGVRHLNRLARQQRRRAVTSEERLQEDALVRL